MKCRASRLRRSLVVAALACALLAARQSGGGETVAAPQLQPSGGETAAVPNPQTRFPPLTTALRKSFAHHLLVNERFRLVLCAIPKVASTELIKLVHRLGDDARWRRDPHFRRDAPLFSRLKARDARRCLDDGNWTWAVFFRDPAARLLSAYRDKFRAGVVANKRYALREFGRESMTFADFVDAVADGSNATRGSPTGLHPWTNPHWRPQRFLCPRPASRASRDFERELRRQQRPAAPSLRLHRVLRAPRGRRRGAPPAPRRLGRVRPQGLGRASKSDAHLRGRRGARGEGEGRVHRGLRRRRAARARARRLRRGLRHARRRRLLRRDRPDARRGARPAPLRPRPAPLRGRLMVHSRCVG